MERREGKLITDIKNKISTNNFALTKADKEKHL
jgi:hypothetical protein